jgi:hypothetical protein
MYWLLDFMPCKSCGEQHHFYFEFEPVRRQLVRLSERQLERPSCGGAGIPWLTPERQLDGPRGLPCCRQFLSVN